MVKPSETSLPIAGRWYLASERGLCDEAVISVRRGHIEFHSCVSIFDTSTFDKDIVDSAN